MPEDRENPEPRRTSRRRRDGGLAHASHPPIFRPPPPDVVVTAPRREPLLPVTGPPRRMPVRHGRSPVGLMGRAGLGVAAALAGVLVIGSSAAVTEAVAPAPASAVMAVEPQREPLPEIRLAPPVTRFGAPLPAPLQTASVEGFVGDATSIDLPCLDTDVTSALTAGDDAAVIDAAGGAVAFRAAVAGGAAPCIPLDDPTRPWVIVDKHHPLVPVDHRPAALVAPEGVRVLDDGLLEPDAAAAMSSMVQAARDAGAGEIAVGSAFRSYETQAATYDSHVARRGQEGADLVSARPGHSEHQTGLAADVLPCDAECGTIDDLAATPQGAWVAENSWRYGWIVRYADGGTAVTGYLPEPWHLRYIGPELAREYHQNGWHTLEEFFGLPPAPQYDH